MRKQDSGSPDRDGTNAGGNSEPDGNEPSGNSGTPIVNLAELEPKPDTGGNAGSTPGKRGRGRPRKDGSSGGSSSGNASGSGDNRTKAGNKRRSRKAENSAALDVGTISLVLTFISGAVAARAKEPTLKLDDAEAAQVAQATANVAAFYDIPVSPVTQAWLALGMTVGSIYAGKIAAIKMRQSAGGNRQSEDVPNVAPFIRPSNAKAPIIENETISAAE